MAPTMPLPCLTEPVSFDVLDEADCEDWVLRVLLMRRYWRRRHAHAPFFTLGLASYLDGGYHDEAALQSNNTLLSVQFAPLFECVSRALSSSLGIPTILADDAALPGFHIYLPDPAFRLPAAQIHRDLQYRDAYPALTPADSELVSFTLPLSTPPGSGLNWWPADLHEPEFFAYRTGTLVVHDGLARHQAVLACDGDLERVTLQGHGIVRDDGRLVLYW